MKCICLKKIHNKILTSLNHLNFVIFILFTMQNKLILATFFLLFGIQFLLINSESVDTLISNRKHKLSTLLRGKRSISCDNSKEKVERIDCSWEGINRTQCEGFGCCFDSSDSNVPNCYIGTIDIRTLDGNCDFSKPKDRKSCGPPGITKSQCETQSCCYDSRVAGAHNCFHANQKAGGIQKDDIEKLISLETKVINSMIVMKERILKAHKDYSISKTVGASVSSLGTVATIVGIFLSPFTAGLSLGLMIGGATAAVLGAGTVLTTSCISASKKKEWTDELIESYGELEEELKKIGEKIITHPDWREYVLFATKTKGFVVSKGPAAIHLARMVKYLTITAPQYGGIHSLGSFYFAVTKLPGASLLQTNTFLTRNLAKMGIHTVKMGVQGLMLLNAGLGVVSIGFDIYTVVDTWTSDPKMVGQIDTFIIELESSRDKLREFLKEF